MGLCCHGGPSEPGTWAHTTFAAGSLRPNVSGVSVWPGTCCWAVLLGRGHDLLGFGSPWPGGPRVLGWVEMSPFCI